MKAYNDSSSPLYAPERFDTALASILGPIEKCRASNIPTLRSCTPNLVRVENGIRRNFLKC